MTVSRLFIPPAHDRATRTGRALGALLTGRAQGGLLTDGAWGGVNHRSRTGLGAPTGRAGGVCAQVAHGVCGALTARARGARPLVEHGLWLSQVAHAAAIQGLIRVQYVNVI